MGEIASGRPRFLPLLGVWICLESLAAAVRQLCMPGAGFFPLLLGILLSFLSLSLLGIHLFGARSDTPPILPARPEAFGYESNGRGSLAL